MIVKDRSFKFYYYLTPGGDKIDNNLFNQKNNENDYQIGKNVIKHLKLAGKDIKIHDFVKIVNPEVVEIEDHAIIDDFTFIHGGLGVKIGKFVHIAGFSSIIGGGKFTIEDFSGCSAGCRFITGTDDFSGNSLTGPAIPDEYKPLLVRGEILIRKFAILGTNTIINPNIEIGEGAATIPGSYVTKNLAPWTLYGGVPARKIKERSQEMKKFEKLVLNKFYDDKY